MRITLRQLKRVIKEAVEEANASTPVTVNGLTFEPVPDEPGHWTCDDCGIPNAQIDLCYDFPEEGETGFATVTVIDESGEPVGESTKDGEFEVAADSAVRYAMSVAKPRRAPGRRSRK